MASIPVLSVVPQNLQVPTLLPPTFPAVQIKHNENTVGVGGGGTESCSLENNFVL